MDFDQRSGLAQIATIINKIMIKNQYSFEESNNCQGNELFFAAKAICDNYWSRSRVLGSRFSCELVWRILFELYIVDVDLAAGKASVTDISVGSETAISTTIRWLNAMVDFGLISRNPDEHDRRRVWIGLTPKGRESVECVLKDFLLQMKNTRQQREGMMASLRG